MEGQGQGQCWIHQATSGDAPAGAPCWLPVPPVPASSTTQDRCWVSGHRRRDEQGLGGLREQKTPLAGYKAVYLQAAGQAASTEPRDEGHRSCWAPKPITGAPASRWQPVHLRVHSPPPSTLHHPPAPQGQSFVPGSTDAGFVSVQTRAPGLPFFFFFFLFLAFWWSEIRVKNNRAARRVKKGDR